MRIIVDHRTTYRYERPASAVVQALRLSPRDHDGQHVHSWRVDADVDGSMQESTDAFGNRLIMFYAEGALSSLTLTVTGEAEVTDTAGVIGAREPLPLPVFLRSTELTTPDAAIADLARDATHNDPLAMLHALMTSIRDVMTFDVATTDSATPAATAFAARNGVCQDFAHIFCAAARLLDIPSRYVSGHLARPGAEAQDASHAWVEAHVPGLGWVAFDPANGICATDAYLRIAVGLDYLDAAPVRGARRGGGSERMAVEVRAERAQGQAQG
ncbi:MAG: transglutaminase family protein [Pseudomonadota bacterium]|nr:transglutaminase family protein [Pseudomonadota bacterium]